MADRIGKVGDAEHPDISGIVISPHPTKLSPFFIFVTFMTNVRVPGGPRACRINPPPLRNIP
jgi:hypothetical protein